MTAIRPTPSALFVTTRWSVVLAAKDRNSTEAMETLCRTYWYPLYAYARSSGHSPADAQDLTQEFFARLLARDYLRVVAPEKGRFRTFLRMAMKRFLANEWDRRMARKRGGTATHVSIDAGLAEQIFEQDRAETLPPDRLYDRRWALALLDEAGGRLAGEYAAAGKTCEILHLKPYLTAERGGIPYTGLAAKLGLSEGAVRVAVHRMRQRFREIFRETLADTVASPAEVEEELRHVIAILGQGP